MQLKPLLILGCGLLLTGCMGSSDPVPAVTQNDPAYMSDLVKAANRIAVAEERLAIATTAIRKVHIDKAEVVPRELQRKMKLMEGRGYLPVFASQLAEQAGYTFRVYGKPPAPAQILSIKYEDISLIDALTDLGVRAGDRATVRVDTPSGRVSVCYPKCGGGTQ